MAFPRFHIILIFHRSHCACPPWVDLDLHVCEHGDQLFSEGWRSKNVEDEVTAIVYKVDMDKKRPKEVMKCFLCWCVFDSYPVILCDPVRIQSFLKILFVFLLLKHKTKTDQNVNVTYLLIISVCIATTISIRLSQCYIRLYSGGSRIFQRGRQPRKIVPTYYLVYFSQELCENEEISGASLTPLQICQCHKIKGTLPVNNDRSSRH